MRVRGSSETVEITLDTILEYLIEGIMITDLEGKIMQINSRMVQCLGYEEKGHLLERSIFESVCPDDCEKVKAGTQACLKNAPLPYLDYTFVRRDGSDLTCKTGINLIRDKEGNPEGYLFCLKVCAESQPAESLRLPGEIYRRIVETADLGVWINDPHGTTLYVNRKMAAMLGYSREEMIRKTGLRLVEIGHTDIGFSKGGAGGAQTMIEREYKLRRKDGGVIWTHVNASPLFSESGTYIGNLMMHTDITDRKMLESALARANSDLESKVELRTLELEEAKNQLEFYTQEIIRVQEDERKRIALELHDDTAQNLALLTLEIDRILESEELLPESVLVRLKKLREDTNRTQNEVRRFSHELRPGVLDYLGLEAALEGLAEDINETGQIRVSLEVSGSRRRLTDEVELALFRIAQEALTNARKHARARKASIRLEIHPRKARLEITDDGVGFSVEEDSRSAVKRGRLGLLGMRERADIINGKITIQSIPNRGTRIVVVVPLDNQGLC